MVHLNNTCEITIVKRTPELIVIKCDLRDNQQGLVIPSYMYNITLTNQLVDPVWMYSSTGR